LERRIQRIKQKLVDIGELRPGVLSKQYNVCGNPNCRCKARPPQKHGPYFQLSWSRRGKSSTRFVRQPELPAVRRQIRNYERLRSLVDQWIEAAMALCEARRPIIQNPRAKTTQ
jgi:hypothetical protein